MWKHTGMTRFQQFLIDTNVWDHMIFHHEILFWIFPPASRDGSRSADSTVHGSWICCGQRLLSISTGLRTFCTRGYEHNEGIWSCVKPTTHTHIHVELGLHSLPLLRHIHPDKFHFITLDFICQRYWDRLSRFPSFPISYHLWSKNVLKIDPLKSVFWAKWHHGHTGDFILISENFIWNLLVNNTMTEKKKKKKNKQNPDAITGLARSAWLDCLPQQELSGGSLSV